VLKYFAPLYVLLIVTQVILAGEGIFGLNNIRHSDDCNKSGAHCIANSTTLDPHRFLGFFLTEPLAFLFLITALLAWHQNRRIRRISILLPFLTFAQAPLAWFGRWTGMFHPLNAFLVLGLFGWLTYQLRQEQPETAEAPAAVAVPAA